METFEPDAAFEAFKTDRDQTTYEQLLSRCPVAHIPPEALGDRATVGYWGIFGYDELVVAARDHKTFSNVTSSPGGPRVIPLQSDPPEHAGIRRMLNPFFSREEVERIEPDLRAFGGEMLATLIAKGGGDFAQEFAFPFPTRALCTFLGIPAENWEIHHQWVSDMEHETGQGLLDPEAAVPMELAGRIIPYIKAAIDAKRAEPGQDVISGIAHAEIGGEPIDDMMAISLV